MEYIISFMIGYLLGCLNLAYVISKIKKVDIQQTGSKNLGASNATMNFGKRIGLLVMLHDILKTVLAIYIARLIFPENQTLAYISGTASVIGHMFPFWLHFKAGKGFACYLGMILSTTKISYFLILLAVCIILTFITDYIVSITFTTILVIIVLLLAILVLLLVILAPYGLVHLYALASSYYRQVNIMMILLRVSVQFTYFSRIERVCKCYFIK